MTSLLFQCGGPELLLQGDQILLRPLTVKDCTERYLHWLNDPEVNRFSTRKGAVIRRAEMNSYVEQCNQSTTALLLGIFSRDPNTTHIGNILLSEYTSEHRRAEIANLIGDRSFWGKGIAIDANSLLIHFGFQELKIHKFCMGNLRRHRAATFVASRLGYVSEGILKEHLFVDGKFEDVIRFGLFKSEFYGKFPEFIERKAATHRSAPV
ncbi:MAG: GNAT family N-acetyltransferase [Fimbriimonadaceae bacterium]|nr:GNAT family N-acetyltransferase [Alphaproteobacteria bacterium]